MKFNLRDKLTLNDWRLKQMSKVKKIFALVFLGILQYQISFCQLESCGAYIDVFPNEQQLNLLNQYTLEADRCDEKTTFLSPLSPLWDEKYEAIMKEKRDYIALNSYRIYFAPSMEYDQFTIIGFARNYKDIKGNGKVEPKYFLSLEFDNYNSNCFDSVQWRKYSDVIVDLFLESIIPNRDTTSKGYPVPYYSHELGDSDTQSFLIEDFYYMMCIETRPLKGLYLGSQTNKGVDLYENLNIEKDIFWDQSYIDSNICEKMKVQHLDSILYPNSILFSIEMEPIFEGNNSSCVWHKSEIHVKLSSNYIGLQFNVNGVNQVFWLPKKRLLHNGFIEKGGLISFEFFYMKSVFGSLNYCNHWD